MTRKTPRKSGFALVLVMVVLVTSAILGTSYLYAAAIYQAQAKGFPDVQRARYLAESGIDHATYLEREHPNLLTGSDTHPLGPYTVDTLGGSYTISCKATGMPNQYLLTAVGTSGQCSQTCRVTIYDQPAVSATTIPQGLLMQYSSVTIPSSFTITGPVQINGTLTNKGKITGQVYATGKITNSGNISPAPVQYAGAVAPPAVVSTSYYSYKYNGQNGTATYITDTDITSSNAIANGKNVTSSNPAGVVVVRPNNSSKTVTIEAGFHFTGTLIVEGVMKIQGTGLTFTGEPGFPAVITTSNITVRQGVTATFDGLVYATTGLKNSSSSNSAKLQFNGGLVCSSGTIGSLKGNHTITYDAAKMTLLSPTGQSMDPPITLVAWNE